MRRPRKIKTALTRRREMEAAQIAAAAAKVLEENKDPEAETEFITKRELDDLAKLFRKYRPPEVDPNHLAKIVEIYEQPIADQQGWPHGSNEVLDAMKSDPEAFRKEYEGTFEAQDCEHTWVVERGFGAACSQCGLTR